MLIRFNALENLKIIGLRVKACDKLKALSADDGMCRPADIKVWIAFDGRERSMLCVAEPQCAHAMRVTGGDTQTGKFCLSVKLVSNQIAFCYRQLVRAYRGEGVLCIDIKGSNVFFLR